MTSPSKIKPTEGKGVKHCSHMFNGEIMRKINREWVCVGTSCSKCHLELIDPFYKQAKETKTKQQTVSESNWEKKVKQRFCANDGDAWDMTDEITDFIRQEKQKSFEEGYDKAMKGRSKEIMEAIKLANLLKQL